MPARPRFENAPWSAPTYEEDPSITDPLEKAKAYFTWAKVQTEVRMTPGMQDKLEEARVAYAAAQAAEIAGALPAGASIDDIAAAAYAAHQSFEQGNVTDAYQEMLDNRSGLQKAAAKVGNWTGKGKLSSWVKSATASSAIGFVGGLLGSTAGKAVGGAATFPISAAAAVATIGTKMFVRRASTIEKNRDIARGLAIDEAAFQDKMRSDRLIAGSATDKQIQSIVNRLSHESVQATNERLRNLIMRVGTVAVFGTIGAVAGGYAADKVGGFITDKIGAVFEDSDLVDVSNGTEVSSVTIAPEPTATAMPTSTLEPTVQATPSVAELPTPDEGVTDLTGDAPVAPAAESATPIPAEADDSIDIDSTDATDQSTSHETDTGSAADAEPQASDAGDANENTSADTTPDEITETEVDTAAEVDADTGLEILTAQVTVGEGDGVTQVLSTVLESAGYPDVPPEQLFEMYEGLIGDPDIGPNKIFEGATLYFNEATGEYWIQETGPFEASLTPEAAEWLQENGFTGVEAEVAEAADSVEQTIEPTENASEQPATNEGDGTGGADSREGLNSEINILEQSVTVLPGDGGVKVLSEMLASAGYDVPAEQVLSFYNQAIEDLGADGVFVDTELVFNEETGWYELPSTGELRLTPQAAVWMTENVLPTIDEGAGIEAIDGGADIPEATIEPLDTTEAGEVPVDSQDIIEPSASIDKVSDFANFTLTEGDQVVDILDQLYTSLGYDLSPEQLSIIEQDIVQGIGVDGLFEGGSIEIDPATGQYVVSESAENVDFTTEATNWLQYLTYNDAFPRPTPRP